ncbi:hypothetical protein D3C72_2092550 [compost metagenome]
MLQLHATIDIADRRFGRRYSSPRTADLGQIFGRLDLGQNIASVHPPEVPDENGADTPTDLRADRCRVGAQIGVVSRLVGETGHPLPPAER